MAFTVSFFAIVIMQANRLPADAKLCGDHWLKCSMVNQGLYNCQIYDKEKRLIKKQAFMLPYKHWRRNQDELTVRAQNYDGDTISLDNGAKLLACDVPYQAEMIQSADGLVWVKYEAVKDEINMYTCEIYSTKDGSLISSGAYVIKKYYWNKNRNRTVYENIKEFAEPSGISYYGGISIALKNNMVLMPVDTIDYSSGPDTGLRVKYDSEGNELERYEY